jgi:hypothetical protein
VNHVAIAHARDLADKVKATPAGQPVLLLVKRKGATHFVAVERK